jgi:hypothetical protein
LCVLTSAGGGCSSQAICILRGSSIVPFACRDEPGNTGTAAWTGYVGPFKARADSTDMADGYMGEVLWNGWPADAVTGAYGS